MKSLRLSIYLKILLLLLTTSILTISLSTMLSTQKIDSMLTSEAAQLSERLASSLAFPFWNLDSTGVSEILEAQIKSANVKAITLTENSSASQFTPGIRKKGARAITLTKEMRLDTTYCKSMPILFEGEPLGEVTVYLTDAHLKSLLIRSRLTESLLELLFMLLMALPLTYLIARSIITPVEKMANAFHSTVVSKFTQPVTPPQERELSTITSIFEELRQTLLENYREIQQNEQDLTTLLNTINDAIIAVDADGAIIRFNRGAQKLCSLEMEHHNSPLESMLALTEVDNPKQAINPLQQPNIRRSKSFRAALNVDTQRRIVSVNSSQFFTQEADYSGAVLTIRDITDEISVEEELKQRRKMESLGQLSGGIAHDFNNMLGGILGFSELLQEDLHESSKEHHFVSQIIQAANSAADLTAKLLAFSRKGKMISTPFPLHATCQSAVELLKRTTDRRVEVQQHYDATNEYITGDPSQIQNVILNLCINAKDAMPDGGTLTLRSSNILLPEQNSQQLPAGEYIQISVQDTGTGIPAKIREQIFEPFFTTKEVGKGTGLGLAAVYGALQNHHGTIELATSDDAGTTFSILLPTVTPPDQIDTATTTREDTSLPIEALIVDDEQINRAMLSAAIESMGGRVHHAEDGVRALEIFREKQSSIDVVILDMVMPKMNGDVCFHKLREIDPNIPVILASGFDKNSSISQLLDEGAVGYLHKPFSLATLEKILIGIPMEKR